MKSALQQLKEEVIEAIPIPKIEGYKFTKLKDRIVISKEDK